jgi:hypothetical protein
LRVFCESRSLLRHLSKKSGEVIPQRAMTSSSGAVTGTLSRAAKVGSLSSGSGCGCSRPGLERFAAEGAERGAGCEMALKIESVVDGGASEEEAVG